MPINNDDKKEAFENLEMHILAMDFEKFRQECERVTKETLDKRKEKIFTWIEHYNKLKREWYNLMPLTEKKLGWGKSITIQEGAIHQLFVRHGYGLFTNLYWIQNFVISGADHQAIRELRLFIEMMIQSYYLDMEYPHETLEYKMKFLQKSERSGRPLTGGRFIGKTGLKNKTEIKKLYKTLSGYVHSSFTEITSRTSSVVFDEELFDLCVEFSDEVMDFIFAIAEEWKEHMQDYNKTH